MELSKAYGSDATGTVKINLWNDTITAVDVNATYKFTNLTTRNANTKVWLNTTKTTVITKIADIEEVDINYLNEMSDEEESYQTTNAQITAIEISQTWECPMCRKPQIEFNSKYPTNRCGNCRLRQKSSSYKTISRATMCLDHTTKVSVSNSTIATYLKKQNLIHFSLDADILEDHFLQNGPFQVIHTNQFAVIDICQTVGSALQTTSKLPSIIHLSSCTSPHASGKDNNSDSLSTNSIASSILTDKAISETECTDSDLLLVFADNMANA